MYHDAIFLLCGSTTMYMYMYTRTVFYLTSYQTSYIIMGCVYMYDNVINMDKIIHRVKSQVL